MSEDEKEPGVEVIGGDELTKRTITYYPATDENILRMLDKAAAVDFWKDMEGRLAACDKILADNGWERTKENQKRFPGDSDTPVYSDLWYAGKIGFLCWILLKHFKEKEALAPVDLARIMSIGALVTEWEWRENFKPAIVSTIDRLTENRKNAPLGGDLNKEAAKESRRILGELALANGTIEKWIGGNPKQQVRSLRQMAIEFEKKQMGGKKLFSNAQGKPRSDRWFSDLLSDWRANGDITRALLTKPFQ